MKYIYCESSKPIFLGLKMKQEGHKICFLYAKKGYNNLFRMLGVDAIYIKIPSKREYFKPSIIKKKIKEVNDIIKTNELHFSHLNFAVFLFLILSNRLKGSNNFFYPFEPSPHQKFGIKEIATSWKSFLSSFTIFILSSIFYKTSMKISFVNKRFFLRLNKKSFQKLNINEVNNDIAFEELQHKIINELQISHQKIENLYIAQNEFSMKGKIYSEHSINCILKFIENSNISVKPHPSGYKYPTSHQVVDPYIPTEFLLNSITNSIISINSTSLISASHYFYNNPNVKIICLMNIVEHYDKALEERMMNRIFRRSKNNIFFPESFQELKNLINKANEK